METHLAEAACLTEGADGAHVALVAGAERRRVEGGGGIQRDARVGPQISGLQVVTLAEQVQVGGWGVGGTGRDRFTGEL